MTEPNEFGSLWKHGSGVFYMALGCPLPRLRGHDNCQASIILSSPKVRDVGDTQNTHLLGRAEDAPQYERLA